MLYNDCIEQPLVHARDADVESCAIAPTVAQRIRVSNAVLRLHCIELQRAQRAGVARLGQRRGQHQLSLQTSIVTCDM